MAGSTDPAGTDHRKWTMTQPRAQFDGRLTDMISDMEYRVITSENERPFPITGVTEGCTTTCVSCDTCTCTCIACDEGGFDTPIRGGGLDVGRGGAINPGGF